MRLGGEPVGGIHMNYSSCASWSQRLLVLKVLTVKSRPLIGLHFVDGIHCSHCVLMLEGRNVLDGVAIKHPALS